MKRPFEKVEIEDERELEALIKKYPGQIEKGLKYLDHQLQVGRGFMDILFVDPDGVLVVGELKIIDDEGILMQAIKYYDVVYRDIDRISRQFPNKGIKIEEDPRIILIAPGFSDEVKRAARHVKPEISLIEFDYIKHLKSGDQGLICREVPFKEEAGYVVPTPVEKVIRYINLPKLRDVCSKVLSEIQAVGDELDIKGVWDTVIRIRYKNRWVADLFMRRSFFTIQYKRGGTYPEELIETKKDWLRVRNKVLKAITKVYEDFGGFSKIRKPCPPPKVPL
jgi:hypothetical protein